MESKYLRKILGCIRRAAEDYDMISPGDRIAVGLSGGKDSLILCVALSYYRRFSPVPFELAAVNVDMGLKGTEKERAALEALME